MEGAMEEGRGGHERGTQTNQTSAKPIASEEQPAVGDATRDQVRSIGGEDVARIAVLSFRSLQLYRIAVLQKKLVGIQSGLFRDGKEPGTDTDQTIQKYGM